MVQQISNLVISLLARKVVYAIKSFLVDERTNEVVHTPNKAIKTLQNNITHKVNLKL